MSRFSWIFLWAKLLIRLQVSIFFVSLRITIVDNPSPIRIFGIISHNIKINLVIIRIKDVKGDIIGLDQGNPFFPAFSITITTLSIAILKGPYLRNSIESMIMLQFLGLKMEYNGRFD